MRPAAVSTLGADRGMSLAEPRYPLRNVPTTGSGSPWAKQRLTKSRYVDISRHMEFGQATEAFAALSQDTRLTVFRLLVEAGAEGMPAGGIARHLGVPHNTMSSHLAILCRAGLVTSRRESRSIIYAADFAGVRALIAFLLRDCCKGRPDAFEPLLDAVLRA